MSVMKETAFAEKLRASHGLTLGAFGDTAFAPDGGPYTVLQGWGGEDEATEAFTQHCAGRTGRLHWRVMPEITYIKHYRGLGGQHFYMRLCLLGMPQCP
jgi:hypothetical protein